MTNQPTTASPEISEVGNVQEDDLYFVEGPSPARRRSDVNHSRRRTRANSTDNFVIANPTSTSPDIPHLTEGYGFVGAFSSAICGVAYFVWAVMPQDFFQKWFHFNSAPSQYWALAIPVFALGAMCFFTAATLAFQLIRTPSLHEQCTYCDRHTLEFDEYAHSQQLPLGTPRFMDIPITIVSQVQFGTVGSSGPSSSRPSSKSNRTMSSNSSQLRSRSRATIEAENELRSVSSHQSSDSGNKGGSSYEVSHRGSGSRDNAILKSPPLLTSAKRVKRVKRPINANLIKEKQHSGNEDGNGNGSESSSKSSRSSRSNKNSTISEHSSNKGEKRSNSGGKSEDNSMRAMSVKYEEGGVQLQSSQNISRNDSGKRTNGTSPDVPKNTFASSTISVEYEDELKQSKRSIPTNRRSVSATSILSTPSSVVIYSGSSQPRVSKSKEKSNVLKSLGGRRPRSTRSDISNSSSGSNNEKLYLSSPLSPLRSRSSAGDPRSSSNPVGHFRSTSNSSVIGRSRRVHSFRRPGGSRSSSLQPRLVSSQSHNSLKHLAMEFADKEQKSKQAKKEEQDNNSD
jgi:hypothetical protein